MMIMTFSSRMLLTIAPQMRTRIPTVVRMTWMVMLSWTRTWNRVDLPSRRPPRPTQSAWTRRSAVSAGSERCEANRVSSLCLLAKGSDLMARGLLSIAKPREMTVLRQWAPTQQQGPEERLYLQQRDHLKGQQRLCALQSVEDRRPRGGEADAAGPTPGPGARRKGGLS